MKKLLFFISIILIIFFIFITNCQQPSGGSSGGGGGGGNKDKDISYSAIGLYDTTFNNGGSGTNGYVNDIALQSDGKILIGGSFTQYNGIDISDRIIRLNTDGSYDSIFNNSNIGADAPVRAIGIQSDGKIIIGGDFIQYNGDDVPDYIIRLNTNGTHDTTFNNLGAGTNGIVRAIAIQPDGNILIGGNFTTYNLLNVPHCIIRLSGEFGSRDLSFNNTSIGANNDVYAIVVQQDGKIIIGGYFSTYNSENVPYGIIRLNEDGTRDTSFNNLGDGTDNKGIVAIAIQKDGKILIGGYLTQYNGVDVPDRIIRLNADGTHDTTFNAGGTGADINVLAIALQPDGKILIGGDFTTYNGIDVPDRIIRLNTDGTYDTTFNSSGAGVNNDIYEIKVQANGKLLIGGLFNSYNNDFSVPDNIIRLY